MNSFLPKWVTAGLGGLLIVFIALLIVQKGMDLKTSVDNKEPGNTLSVSAEGKATASPDLATVTIGVLSQGANATEVKNKNNDKVNKIIAFIKEQGIDSKDIATSQYNFYPQQDYSKGFPVITGYQGNQTVTVKVHGIDQSQTKLESILDGSVNNGANEIQGVFFTFENPDILQQKAREDAIAKAKVKGQQLADQTGLKLGKIVGVSEGQGGYFPPMPYAQSSARGIGDDMNQKSIAPSIEPGSQDVNVSISVVFEVK